MTLATQCRFSSTLITLFITHLFYNRKIFAYKMLLRNVNSHKLKSIRKSLSSKMGITNYSREDSIFSVLLTASLDGYEALSASSIERSDIFFRFSQDQQFEVFTPILL